MRLLLAGVGLFTVWGTLSAQAPGVGQMRNITSALGVVARAMTGMVQDINRRLDSLPGRTSNGIRWPAAPAVKAYRALRKRFYGRDAYDFGESSLNVAAFRLGRENRFDEATALLTLNEELFPTSSGLYGFRGNISLMRGDTTAAGQRS